MSARSKARKRALDVLFEADAKGVPVASVLAETVRRRRTNGDPALNDYTVQLVEGLVANQSAVDSALAASLEDWSLDRLPAVDREVLRLGAYEILFVADVPNAVAIDEAVELARSLSTEESPAFVNGVLGAVQRSQRV
ncbi:MAG TPA: transcription antitermination factor NusB [Acidimicrobiia bacterium]|nr:transcription antitermination factor NusB [Candidatus Nanopelagicales bacterium]